MNLCSLLRIGVPWLWYARHELANQYTNIAIIANIALKSPSTHCTVQCALKVIVTREES